MRNTNKKQAKTVDRQLLPALSAARRVTLSLLNAAYDCLLVFEGAYHYRYRGALMCQGPEGVRRVIREEERRQIMQRLRDMRRRGLIEERRKSGKIHFVLTEDGKAARFRLLIKSSPLRRDGKKILVVFDVPERQRAARASMRTFLRTCGFKMMQKSVWISERDIFSALISWIRRERLQEWVRVFLTEEIK